MNIRQLTDNVQEIADSFARERGERQARQHLDPKDFDLLGQAGYLRVGVPVADGGIWENVPNSTRPISEVLRVLAHGDPSVALVSAMHPSVLAFWLASPDATEPNRSVWKEQQETVCRTALDGAWWGTITSEPGSGGDVAQSKAVATSDNSGHYRLSGQKHFGSGSGISSFMVTTAVPDGKGLADWFYLDMRGIVEPSGRPKTDAKGITLLGAWDGHGMTATQSHGFLFEEFPATRFAWNGRLLELAASAFGFIDCCFTGVIVGIIETALDTARAQLQARRSSLRPFEATEWTRAEMEGWLIQQAYEGMLRAVERQEKAGHAVLQGKTAVSELAESVMTRICRVMGGGTFSRRSPYGCWFEDVRALGFLRPPWSLAYDRLFDLSLPEPKATP